MTTLSRLQDVMRDVFANPSLIVDPSMTAMDVPGWDSMSNAILIVEIETVFGVSLSQEEMDQCADVQALVELIGRKA